MSLSSGILLTLGADVAPQSEPAAFLGSWRTLTDAGGAAAPLLFSGIAAISSLAIGAAVIGVVDGGWRRGPAAAAEDKADDEGGGRDDDQHDHPRRRHAAPPRLRRRSAGSRSS